MCVRCKYGSRCSVLVLRENDADRLKDSAPRKMVIDREGQPLHVLFRLDRSWWSAWMLAIGTVVVPSPALERHPKHSTLRVLVQVAIEVIRPAVLLAVGGIEREDALREPVGAGDLPVEGCAWVRVAQVPPQRDVVTPQRLNDPRHRVAVAR